MALQAQELLSEMCIPMNESQLKALMLEVDADGSGEIDFDEVSEALAINSTQGYAARLSIVYSLAALWEDRRAKLVSYSRRYHIRLH